MDDAAPRRWTLDDIPWDEFQPLLVDRDLVRVVKAAALVESNGRVYGDYLCGVFSDDPEFQADAREWAREEEQHGAALAKWAKLADPSFDHAAAFGRFKSTITLPVNARESVRGNRSSELISRCIVEVGTSSLYSALQDATEEPVLREICRNIAADEVRHFKLFRVHLDRYQATERLPLWRRLKVAFDRIRETGDDELAFAYYAANGARGAYDRKSAGRAYARRAYRNYRRKHIERAASMAFKAVGLRHDGRLCRWAARATAWVLARVNRRLAAAGA